MLPLALLLSLPLDPSFGAAHASSTLKGKYAAANLLDGNPETAWCEGKPDEGVGESVQIDLNRPALGGPLHLQVRAGYHKSGAILGDNGAPSALDIVVHGGGADRTTRVTLAPRLGIYENLRVTLPPGATSIELRIAAVRAGAKFKDTCITDVALDAAATFAPKNWWIDPQPAELGGRSGSATEALADNVIGPVVERCLYAEKNPTVHLALPTEVNPEPPGMQPSNIAAFLDPVALTVTPGSGLDADVAAVVRVSMIDGRISRISVVHGSGGHGSVACYSYEHDHLRNVDYAAIDGAKKVVTALLFNYDAAGVVESMRYDDWVAVVERWAEPADHHGLGNHRASP